MTLREAVEEMRDDLLALCGTLDEHLDKASAILAALDREPDLLPGLRRAAALTCECCRDGIPMRMIGRHWTHFTHDGRECGVPETIRAEIRKLEGDQA